MTNSSSNSGGIGLPALLAVLFIALKLTGVIAWSWLWVLAPFWIPLALVVAVVVCGGLVIGVAKLIHVLTTSKEDRVKEKQAARARKLVDSFLSGR